MHNNETLSVEEYPSFVAEMLTSSYRELDDVIAKIELDARYVIESHNMPWYL